MNLMYNVAQVMHRIRVKLYNNHLPGYEKTLIARTDSEATLNIEQVCAALRDRGGFKGDFADLVENVKKYMIETAYQLCDGFTINNGYYSIYPNLGGIFKDPHDSPDPQKNPLTFRFRPLAPLRKLAESIAIVIEGEADTDAYIYEFLDHENDSVNGVFEPGDLFMLTGSKIKVEGDDPSCGLYLVPKGSNDPSVKVTRIIRNTASELIGIIPEIDWAWCNVEVRTQFAGSGGVFLKKPRVITSRFSLEHV